MADKGKSYFGLNGDQWQIVGAVAGLVGALAAIVAIWQGSAPATPTTPAAPSQSIPSSAPAEPAPSSATSPADTPPPSPAPDATRTGTARLTFAQDGFDIDTISVGADDNTPDLALENGVFYVALNPLNDARLARADDEPRTPAACAAAWQVVSDVRLAGAGRTKGFGVGSQLCLTTSSGNVASLRVAKVHDSTDEDDWWVELDVIVWGVK